VAVRSEQFRYIRYADGSEEFYDHRNDPDEWNNLAKDPAFRDQMDRHSKALPRSYAPILKGRSTGHDAYEAASRHLKR
jgi:hypothetical protein